MTNHLLAANFSAVKPSEVPGEIEALIKRNLASLETLLSTNSHYTWENLLAPLEGLDDELNRYWSPVSHLNSVMNNDEIRKAYQACLPLLSEYGTQLGQHKPLFEAIKTLKESAQFSELTVAQQKAITDDLRDFHLAGVDLEKEKQERFKAIKKRLSELTSKYEENLLDATNGWTYSVTEEKQLEGLPAHVIDAAKARAAEKNQNGYLFDLTFPSYQPVLSYADDQKFREIMYTAYATRASDQGPNAGKWDNSKVMNEILALRQELAQLLGYANYAEVSLATKMADTPEEVMTFLSDLAERAKKQAQAEYKQVCEFAKKQFGIKKLEAWDLAYYSEKLREQEYDFSPEQLRPYFPIDKVLSGMFSIVNRLYGIELKQNEKVDVYHPSVRFYEIWQDGELIAGVYVDLFARQHKRGGAWMDECVVRRRDEQGNLQLPIAYLTCNFAGPTDGRPALFCHEEVLTLFHEFGHCLHHLLTKIETAAMSGINGVYWDAVEFPSQFFENWCWQEEALQLCAEHYETKQALPKDLFDKMIAAKDFQSAMQLVRQMEFSLFDLFLHWHYKTEASSPNFIQKTLDELREQIGVVPVPDFNRFQHGFSHIFAGGYAAGYYSYKWAEVLSSDAFSKFEEQGIFDRATGQEYLDNVLSQGGSRDAMDLFVAFRGRKPKIDALLRHNGIQ